MKQNRGVSSSRAWLIAATFALATGACGESAPPPPPPVEVQVATVLRRDLPVFIENIGQTLGSQEVEVRARVEGFLDTVNFREGSFVKKGDLLYTIDPRNLEAALAQAKGQLARAKADLARASQDVARYRPLIAQNAIPRQQFDTAVQIESAAKAAVEAAQAAADNATINLDYTKVYSPIDGLVGKTEVKPGNLVGRGDNTLLTTVSTIDPIHVRFTISERDYLRLARAGKRASGDEQGTLELVLADGSVHEHGGTLLFADRVVDPTTGTLLIEAEFPNPGRLIRPGQYGRVRAPVDVKTGAILVPQRAVRELQATFSVAVVKDGVVSMRTVQPGERTGSLWAIDSGLAPGEQVVVEGLQKVRDGMKVQANVVSIVEGNGAGGPVAAPGAAAAPSPARTADAPAAH